MNMMRSSFFILVSCLLGVKAQSVKVAAYYYPWHADDFHRNQGYVRELMNHTPTLGEYDDRDPAVIRQHMAWSKQANIDVWITSWFGPGSREDETILSTVMPTIEGSNLEFCILYETGNRIRKNTAALHRVVADINHVIDNFVYHPNYYHINGRPVVFMYITRVLESLDILAETLLLIRSTGAKRDVHFYLVGDHAFGKAPATDLLAFDFLDAVSNYDVYGQLGRYYVGPDRLAEFYEEQALWSIQARRQDCAFLPSVTPGYNDRAVRLAADHKPLSRKLTKDSDFGSLFRESLAHATKLVDPDADNLLVVTSFNEWHEDTQIEPAVGALTNVPYNYTLGIEYEGYGTMYLDILREMTINGTNPSYIPPDDPTPDSCDDSKSLRFPVWEGVTQVCIWLAARPFEQAIYCQPGQDAYTICEETCGKCTDDCEDSDKSFSYKGISRPCSWLAIRIYLQPEVCAVGGDAYKACPETCDACD